MSITRRNVLLGGAAAIAAPLTLRTFAFAQGAAKPLPTLPVLDATESAAFDLVGMEGETEFSPGALSRTMGFSQPYLGPVVRLRTGTAVQASVENRTSQVISVHWHGLLIPGEVDGGPHNPIAPGEVWRPVLPVDQPPATLWYHTHVHGQTAQGVYSGLAGVLIIDDGRDAERGLPDNLGVDDLVLVLQDKRFGPDGTLLYQPTEADIMHGFLGDTVLVNGTIGATASVPAGIVRLRLLNATNGRNLDLAWDDGRAFHLIATDQGFLTEPLPVERLRMSPGERAEILVDFAPGQSPRLISSPHEETAGASGMGHDMATAPLEDPFTASFTILEFEVDDALVATVDRLPGTLAEVSEPMAQPGTTRTVVLNDSMMMAPAAGGMAMPDMNAPMPMGDHAEHVGAAAPAGAMPEQVFGINGQPFDMTRIDFQVTNGTVERWVVGGQAMGHPFHIHGARFRVVAPASQAERPEHAGWKDTVLVEGEMELLVEFGDVGTADHPFMFHCHVLEHEDRGMMGQFVVLAQAAPPAAAYRYEQVGDATRTGRRVRFGIRLTSNGDPISGAQITALDFNMSPEGMAGSNDVMPMERDADGTQWFEAIPDMGGRWQVVLEAQVPGVEAAVRGNLVVVIPK